MNQFETYIAIAGGSIVILTALIAVTYSMLRAGTWKLASEEWKNLAEARNQKITDLEKRVVELETKMAAVIAETQHSVSDLMRENAELRGLNIGYQREVNQLRERLMAKS